MKIKSFNPSNDIDTLNTNKYAVDTKSPIYLYKIKKRESYHKLYFIFGVMATFIVSILLTAVVFQKDGLVSAILVFIFMNSVTITAFSILIIKVIKKEDQYLVERELYDYDGLRDELSILTQRVITDENLPNENIFAYHKGHTQNLNFVEKTDLTTLVKR